MISARLNGQIFANIAICPYCSLGEEGKHYIFPKLTPLQLTINKDEKWADTPQYRDLSLLNASSVTFFH